VIARRGRRYKQLLDDLKEKIVIRKMKKEAQDRALWRARLKEAIVVRLTTEQIFLHLKKIKWVAEPC
jgi:CRISPR/Cas system CMR-associated protein Cmr5 small subunit